MQSASATTPAPTSARVETASSAAARTAPPAFLRRTSSPIGEIELTSDGSAITSLAIAGGRELAWRDLPERSAPVLDKAVAQLAEYFAGTRHDFDLPISVEGTDFQKAVWHELSLLPFGNVASYGEIGSATGRATAGRAVGGAVGANPIPLIVPCHRVLGTNKRITGYSAGAGIPTKAWLLDHEGIEHRS